jgi:transcriptional regulator with XRE-family HTH domain
MTERPRTAEDAASYKGMGQTITLLREEAGMDRDAFAAEISEDRPTLEKVESGEVDAHWGTLRAVARALSLPLDVLIELAEECAPGPGGEEWRRWTREFQQERDLKVVG